MLKTFLFFLLVMLVAGSALGDVSVGFRIGPPPPPRVIVQPAAPGLGYIWVEGYWYPAGHRYRWHDGYWTRPPYEGYHWIAPRYEGERYFGGYWDGSRGRFEHNHRWDRDRDRDNREHDRH
jgi:hypothetical protein